MTIQPVEATGAAYDFLARRDEVLQDYYVACLSREASLISRREVLTGKAKFAVSGDGKEIPQLVMARAFRQGDFRSGYYRDQTFMLAIGAMTLEDFFAQLYADTEHDPFSAGRLMNAHFATPLVNEQTGQWLRHIERNNVSADISSTAGQMARALGLALASKKYRELPELDSAPQFSDNGNEVSFCTIGDASTSEGVFWESINAAVVQQVPLAVFVWDDGYGISVPKKYQTAKANISAVLSGFQGSPDAPALAIYTLKGWDYATLMETIPAAIANMRSTHEPALFHIEELTQPQGHSTSGSHERYKSKERLQWEKEQDCILQMRHWMLATGLADADELDDLQKKAQKAAKEARDRAWKASLAPAKALQNELLGWYQQIGITLPGVEQLIKELEQHSHPLIAEIQSNARRLAYLLSMNKHPLSATLGEWCKAVQSRYRQLYAQHQFSETEQNALKVTPEKARYSDSSPVVNGFEVINAFFKQAFARFPELLAFGEDLGKIGGVNQGFSGLQQIFGEARIFDAGIREWTIMGQAIGLAMRGFRPIGEIQYLDYFIYGLPPLVDDLTTLRWRSHGRQKAPMIVRTRGHRLEGVWHSGSPMGMLLNGLRGVHLCVPRNMVQAVGMYNTLLHSDEPGVVIECLNGYRLKERLPDNLSSFKAELGVPEILREGTDVTLLTYGSSTRLAEQACDLLANFGVSVELIDAQTLLPFDRNHIVAASLQKTNRLLVVDEDVPGGATAYLLQQVMEVQQGYRYLDAQPTTLTAALHRPPYGTDGDYFSKPSVEDMVDAVLQLMAE